MKRQNIIPSKDNSNSTGNILRKEYIFLIGDFDGRDIGEGIKVFRVRSALFCCLWSGFI